MSYLPSVVGQALENSIRKNESKKKQTPTKPSRQGSSSPKKKKKKKGKQSTPHRPGPKITVEEPTGLTKAYLNNLLGKPKDNLSPREAKVLKSVQDQTENIEEKQPSSKLELELTQDEVKEKAKERLLASRRSVVCKSVSFAPLARTEKIRKKTAYFPKRRETLKNLECERRYELDSWLTKGFSQPPTDSACGFVKYSPRVYQRFKDIEEDDSEEESDLEIELRQEEPTLDTLENGIDPTREDFVRVFSRKLTSQCKEGNSRDLKSIALQTYEEQCNKAGVVPEAITVFRNSKAANHKEIDLRWYGLGDKKAVYTTKECFSDLHVKKMLLVSNRISDKASAKLIIQQSWKHLAELDLSDNKVGAKGVHAIAELLRSSTNQCVLETLKLKNNKLRTQNIETLVDGLLANGTLKSLDLSRNSIGLEGAKALSQLMLGNSTLEVLNLSWTHLQAKGVEMLFESLTVNTDCGLLDLDLSCNALGTFKEDCFKALEALGHLLSPIDSLGKKTDSFSSKSENSHALTHLNLSHNLLDHSMCKHISSILQDNNTLLGLHMAGNACSLIDSNGFLLLSDETNKANRTKGNTSQEFVADSLDENLRFLERIQRGVKQHKNFDYKELQFFRSRVANSWEPGCYCWVCCGWTEKRFTIIAQKNSIVCFHTCFDSPAWLANEMRPTRRNELGQKSVEEYEIFKVCPPIQLLFFFTVNGQPVISSKYAQLPFNETARRLKVPPPPMHKRDDSIKVNLLSMPIRQLDRILVKKNERVPPKILPDTRTSTWGFNKEDSIPLLNYFEEEEEEEEEEANEDYSADDIPNLVEVITEVNYDNVCDRTQPRKTSVRTNMEIENIKMKHSREIKPVGSSSSWDFSFSIFFSYKHRKQNEQFLKALALDLRYINLEAVLPTPELIQVRSILKQYYGLFLDIFHYYCAVGENTDHFMIHSISVKAIEILFTDTGIIDQENLASEEVNQAIQGINKRRLKNSKVNENPFDLTLAKRSDQRNSLNRHEFMELIVRMALKRYSKVPSESRRVKLILESNLAPKGSYRNVEAFQYQRLYNHVVDECLRTNYTKLFDIFKASSGKYSVPTEEPWMSVEEWVEFCYRVELFEGTHKKDEKTQFQDNSGYILDERLTVRLVRHIFLWSREEKEDENYGTDRFRLRFIEFLIAICNVAAVLAKNKGTFFKFERGWLKRRSTLAYRKESIHSHRNFDHIQYLVESLQALLIRIKKVFK